MPRPIIPADLQATIDRHLALFAGWQMMAEGGDSGAEGAEAGGSADQGADGDQTKDGDKLLGPNGEKALAAERDARKKSDQKVAALEAQFAKLAEAFGVKPDESKPDGADKVDALAKAVDTILHNSTVDRVARDHGITDKDDLALLREQANEQAMERLATRLKPATGEDGKTKTSAAPRPDRSAGKGGGDSGGAKQSVSQVMAERRKAREASK
jgi:hypothetical protein